MSVECLCVNWLVCLRFLSKMNMNAPTLLLKRAMKPVVRIVHLWYGLDDDYEQNNVFAIPQTSINFKNSRIFSQFETKTRRIHVMLRTFVLSIKSIVRPHHIECIKKTLPNLI